MVQTLRVGLPELHLDRVDAVRDPGIVSERDVLGQACLGGGDCLRELFARDVERRALSRDRDGTR